MKRFFTLIALNVLIFSVCLLVGLIVFKHEAGRALMGDQAAATQIIEMEGGRKHVLMSSKNWKGRGAELGFTPDSSRRHELFVDGKKIYDVTYHIDERGLRKTINPTASNSTIHLYGCSDTFGFGLSDDQTLSSQLSEKLGQVRVENHGVPGTGGSVFYHLLTTKDLPRINARDLIIYVASGDHLVRNVALAPPYLGHLPEYAVSEGRPIYLGPFERNSLKNFFRRTLLESSLVMRLLAHFDVEPPARARELNCALLSEAANTIRKKEADFLVLLHPNLHPGERQIFQECLSQLPAVNSLNVEWTPEKDKTHFIPFDEHPSQEGNAELAQLLTDWIRSRK